MSVRLLIFWGLAGVAFAQSVLAAQAEGAGEVNPQLRWSRGLMPVIRSAVEPGAATYDAATAPAAAEAGARFADQTERLWTILLSDKTLYRTMRRWASEANYQLLWQVDRDYPIEVAVDFKGDLRQAVEQVVAGVALTDYPIQAIFNTQARVVRVLRHMDEGQR